MIIDYLVEDLVATKKPILSKTTLQRLSKHNKQNTYITFTDLPTVTINSNTKWNTPLGIYVYPIWFIIDEWDNLTKHGIYALDRKYINVLKNVGNKTVSDLGYDYTKDMYVNDVKKILYSLPKKYEFLTSDNLKELLSHVKTRKDVYKDSYGSIIYSFIQMIAIEICEKLGKTSPKYVAQVQTMIWKDLLKYDMIGDDSNLGLIHPNEPSQAIFFDTNAFDIIEQIENEN